MGWRKYEDHQPGRSQPVCGKNLPGRLGSLRYSIELKEVFHTTVERAFQTPILGDARTFLTGYRFQPPVIDFEDDETWGQVQGFRYPVTEGNFWIPPGRLFRDEILAREENAYWKWTLYDFQVPLMFFVKVIVGEWEVYPRSDRRISVVYRYTLYSKNVWLHPFTLLFCRIQWKGMMKRALSRIKALAELDLPL